MEENSPTTPPVNKTPSQEKVPNSTAALVLGIISITFGWCPYFMFFLGLVVGIIGIALSSSGQKAYLDSPEKYSKSSYSNLKAGRVCAIIGACFGAIWLLVVILAVVGVVGSLPYNY